MCDHFWPWDKGLHLSAGEKKLDNTTIVKIPERLLRMMLIEGKVDMSIKGGVVNMLKDIRRRCWIFDSQTTLTCLHLLTISQMRMARDQRLSSSWRKKNHLTLYQQGVPLSQKHVTILAFIWIGKGWSRTCSIVNITRHNPIELWPSWLSWSSWP